MTKKPSKVRTRDEAVVRQPLLIRPVSCDSSLNTSPMTRMKRSTRRRFITPNRGYVKTAEQLACESADTVIAR